MADIGRLRVPQDLHVHTTFSSGDDSVAPEQTLGLLARLRHADVLGISDHLDFVAGEAFGGYRDAVRAEGLGLGVEVDGARWLDAALEVEGELDYYVVHCRDRSADYAALERLVQTGLPVILAHPLLFGTRPERVAPGCLVEVNNRYVWRNDWRRLYPPWQERFRFVIGSDAHQPSAIGQLVARMVAGELGIRETVLF
jgi:histidinol phosphatase-like PHP family hydrolase